METPNQKYFIEKTYTFMIEHGLEGAVEASLQQNAALRLVNGENGSGIVIIKKADFQDCKPKNNA
jgi:hypothetical protein